MITPKIRLNKIIEEGKIPHLLLFTGPKETHKEEEAEEFALRVLKGEKNHPDLHVLSPEGKSGMHSITSIKTMLAQAALYPSRAHAQFFIIHDAERLLPSTANALLKTLEEPSSPSFFILLTRRPDWILPTIASRAQKIIFQGKHVVEKTAAHSKIIEWLKEGVSIEEIEAFAKADEKRRKEKEKRRLAALPSEMNPHDRETLVKEMEGSLAIEAREEFFLLLERISLWYRDLYLLRSGIQAPLIHTDLSSDMEARKNQALPLLQVEEALRFSRLSFERSVSLQTCLEALFLRLERVK